MSEPAQDGDKAQKKPTTKAERRALQEAQRAAKAAKKEAEAAARAKGVQLDKQTKKPQGSGDKKPQKEKPKAEQKETKTKEESNAPKEPPQRENLANIHPAIQQVAAQYKHYTVKGGNARCVSCLTALKQVIQDFTYPPSNERTQLSKPLITHLNQQIAFLVKSRKLSISMGNAIHYVKRKTTTLCEEGCTDENELRKELVKAIDMFIYDRILTAGTRITQHGVNKVEDRDVLLTYGRSTAVELIIKAAHDKNKQFRVIVVDSRPFFEGRAMATRLTELGVKVTYCLLSALSNVLRDVTKVFIGASAVMTTGHVYGRAGTAVVCGMAHTYQKPVLVCCETYKFTDKSWLNSLTNNEEANIQGAMKLSQMDEADNKELLQLAQLDNLSVNNLLYDLTPAEFLSMIISEVGMIPPTSVPVVIREYHLAVN
eukprot:TRINITY_DN67561_c8_g1_i2.p1 TRINITY_DN67561_c8_g1~~TRINITY_DN67561_c8_g1_i2.p1  ORF type:complete len:428 (-),score=41.13 TRINITY_DN67561_c8_g1_i2:96-1379(-)